VLDEISLATNFIPLTFLFGLFPQNFLPAFSIICFIRKVLKSFFLDYMLLAGRDLILILVQRRFATFYVNFIAGT